MGRSKTGTAEELEIIRPVTQREEMTMNRREMMSMAAAATAAAMPMAANAGEEISESLRKKSAPQILQQQLAQANPILKLRDEGWLCPMTEGFRYILQNLQKTASPLFHLHEFLRLFP